MTADRKVFALLDNPMANETLLNSITYIEFCNVPSAFELWNKISKSSAEHKFQNLKVLILESLQERIKENFDSLSTLLSYTTIVTDYYLETGKWLANSLLKECFSAILSFKVQSRMQRQQYYRNNVILLLYETLKYSSKSISLIGNQILLEKLSEDNMFGVMQGIHDSITSKTLGKERIQVTILFDEIIKLISANPTQLDLVRGNEKLRILTENIFIIACDEYWMNEDSELGVLYLEKGSHLLKSAKLAFHSRLCAIQKELTENGNFSVAKKAHKMDSNEKILLECEQILTEFPLEKNFNDFLYFLERLLALHKNDAVILICEKYRRTVFNTSFIIPIVKIQVKCLIIQKNILKLTEIVMLAIREHTSVANSLLIQIWLSAESKHFEKNFNLSFELFKICNLLLNGKNTENEANGSMVCISSPSLSRNEKLNLPVTDIYKRLLQLSIQLKKETDLPDNLSIQSDDETINFLLFKVNVSTNKCHAALLNFAKLKNSTALIIECLYFCTSCLHNFSVFAVVIEILNGLEIKTFTAANMKIFTKLIMHFLTNIPYSSQNKSTFINAEKSLKSKNSNVDIQKSELEQANCFQLSSNFSSLLLNNPQLLECMKSISITVTFKLLWNLSISNLQCYSYEHSYRLLAFCESLHCDLGDCSLLIALFVAGVCCLKSTVTDEKLSNELALKLNEISKHDTLSYDELYAHYHREYLVLTNNLELLRERIEQCNLCDISGLLSISLHEDVTSYLFDVLIDLFSKSEKSYEEKCMFEGVFQEMISTFISYNPSAVFNYLSNQVLFSFLSKETIEWSLLIVYNYCVFLRDSVKNQSSIQWAELGLSIGEHLKEYVESTELVEAAKSLYISLFMQ